MQGMQYAYTGQVFSHPQPCSRCGNGLSSSVYLCPPPSLPGDNPYPHIFYPVALWSTTSSPALPCIYSSWIFSTNDSISRNASSLIFLFLIAKEQGGLALAEMKPRIYHQPTGNSAHRSNYPT